MKNNMRLRYIYWLALSLFISVGLTSCYDEKAKDLEGSWSKEVKNGGFYGINEYTFICGEEENYFTQMMVPINDNGIGFQVDGTWEIDWRGDLVMRYDKSSLELLTNQAMPEWDLKSAEGSFSMDIAVRNAQVKKGAAIPFEIIDDELIMTTRDGKERFTWSEDPFYSEDEE